jgi:hypothetical protein
MRGFREVERNIEREKLNQEEEKKNRYKQIKPETDITLEEVKNFWNDIFA